MNTKELTYLDTLITEMQEKEQEIKALQDEIDSLKALLRDTMTSAALTEITTANHHVTFSQCERANVDKKTLQTEYPDIFGKVVKISKYTMLRIK